ncbi:MAG: trypsin-like peptidase domain-containing protein [Planctomycetes bacterium]|nr:trypsin-like peptidase domain-containing protein [Planctomycetota bacterium]
MKRLVLATVLLLAPTARGGDDLLVQARALEAEVVATVDRVRPAVVAIEARGGPEGGLPARGGSGVIIDASGLVLTNHHVVGRGAEVFVTLAGRRRLRATVLGEDESGDLCLLRLPGPGPFPSVEFGDPRALRVGDWLVAMGNPRGVAEDGRAAVSFGILSARHVLGGGGPGRRLFYGDALQTDAEVNPGNSGGPLFDLSGRLMGINGRIATRIQAGGGGVNSNVGFAIPADQIRRFLPHLLAGGEVRHGYLGVRAHEGEAGVVSVAVVLPQTAAETAGLRPGDVLLAMDGEPVTSTVRLLNLVSSRPAGDRVALRIRRDGAERILIFPLGERVDVAEEENP